MSDKVFYFAGGGTGGHIYPAIAVAEQLRTCCEGAQMHFFCSDRAIDSNILRSEGFDFTVLPARGFSARPPGLVKFVTALLRSRQIANEQIAQKKASAVLGVGGFVAAPVCWAAKKAHIPVGLLNVDFVPGKANRVISRWAREIYTQFEDSARYFRKTSATVDVTGCPLRSEFTNPDAQKAIEQLQLDTGRKILLVTGASSGSRSINQTVCGLVDRLEAFADNWQVVHLAGIKDFETVTESYAHSRIKAKVLAYWEDMGDLLAAADLVIGRAGGVSVAEYAASATPSICMPYPHHTDRHQYYNAGKLVEAGAAIIVDDIPNADDRMGWLWEELEQLMGDEGELARMSENCGKVGRTGAAAEIAGRILEMSRG